MAKISKDKILTLVSSFLPGRIVSTQHGRDWDRARGFELLDVSLLYADISGFTAMSEKLASLGKEGAEEVNKLINGFFDPMIKTIFKYNGDIYRF